MDHINGTKGQSNNAPHQIRGKRSFENDLFYDPFFKNHFFQNGLSLRAQK